MNTQQSVPWHKVPITWLIFGIPLVAVVVGIFLIIISINSFDGLVVDDYYKKGLGINQTLKRQHLASSYQLKADLRINSDNQKIDLIIRGNKTFSPQDTISLGMYHSTQSGKDHIITLQKVSDSQYSGKWPTLAPGRWNLLLETITWRLEQTLNWPSETRIIQFSAE